MRMLLSITIMCISVLLVFPFATLGQSNMQSPRFKIQGGNVNIGAEPQESANYDLGVSLGQTAANEFTSSGYIVKAGFQYIHSIIPFTFSISNTTMNLGELMPNVPSTVDTTLTVSFGGAGQYQVTADVIGPLRTISGNQIPHTECNGGPDTCTITSAKEWTSNSTYGFGYSMTGTDIATDFIDNTFFRPFSDSLNAETPAVVMSNTNVTLNSLSTPQNTTTATMQVKANIGPVQPAGTYQTIIRYVATPSY